MKKALIFAVLAILVVCMGCQAVQSRKCTNTSPQQVVSSETPTAFSSLPSSVELEAEPALLSSSQALKLPVDLVKAAVPLDWNKYHLKDFNLKTVNGKNIMNLKSGMKTMLLGRFSLLIRKTVKFTPGLLRTADQSWLRKTRHLIKPRVQ